MQKQIFDLSKFKEVANKQVFGLTS